MTQDTKGKENREARRKAFKGINISRNLDITYKAKEAEEFLFDNGGFWGGTKAQFATALGWLTSEGEPDRRIVEDVCTLTRDQESLPQWQQDILAGFVISYAPSAGGMTLIDPSESDMPLHHYVHMLAGDMQFQQRSRTINRRRLPAWQKAGAVAANGGDQELARLFWQGENEISRTGFVSETTSNDLNKVFMSRALDGSG